MKDYINRLKEGCPTVILALWWILRLFLAYAFCMSIAKDGYGVEVSVGTALSFLSTFLWEIMMASPKNSFLRFMPSSIHTFINLGAFAYGFLGLFLNFSYNTVWFDPLLKCYYCAFAVFFGYEIAWAIIKKQRSSATKAMMFYVAFGISFIALNVLELYEFAFDQIAGAVTGVPTDLQHWSLALAQGTARERNVFDAIDPSRWPLMSTMADIVLGTISAFVALFIINVYPYRNKGKFRYVTDFEAIAVAAPLEKDGNNLKEWLQSYKKRFKANTPKRTYIIWWIIRGAMIALAIYAFIVEPAGSIYPLEILMNLAVMFIWEVAMASPPRNVFRHITPTLQTLIALGDFIAVCAGYLFNFYYEVRLWDSGMHFLCGILAVYFGYEIICALFKLEKRTASLTLMILASTGFCFMVTTFWEIFEFSCDQIVGMMSGVPNDVQHWSYDLAYGTPKFQTLFDYIDLGRWGLMDTMGDIVLNTAGAVLGTIGLIIYPYRNKGKFKFDFDFEKTTETVK